ncbi:hypothetical protein AOXY_G12409 [Acipenser oxyrinchus oxyrinchus]|uniref:Uncharacterized protein n=1 Tax=Acipenser oxyrinchus oxyrinchus TaxID=40147 RepID=A0AAD8G310_ACIOX|nr:hypothetical protein AOXY_G12409 [Acipenser oxyrinchus oxyrinchus]
MRSQTGPCLWSCIPQSQPAPRDRHKHACCTHGNSVYLLGGRETNVQNDFWRYNVVSNEWHELDCNTDGAPEELEEHTIEAHQGILYVFGGMLDSAYSEGKTPLWMYALDTEEWVHWQRTANNAGRPVPINRKGHSAVIWDSAMHIYGGYIDMKGSSQEFWTFHFDSQEWSLLAPSSCDAGPGPRHGHSATVYRSAMFLYGGLMGLREKSDFWKWNFCSQSWACIKTLSGPSKLIGHSAVVYKDCMLLFGGGETQNFPKNVLWKFSFTSLSWEKLGTSTGTAPPSKIYHCCAGLGPSFQTQSSRDCSPQGSPTGHERDNCSKYRPFKNRLYPASNCVAPKCPEEGIEMQTFFIQSDREPQGGREKDALLHSPVRMESCITDRTACEGPSPQDSFISYLEAEDSMAACLPDSLLVIGGKPWCSQTSVSIWQMTLTDVQKHGRRADSAGGNAMTLTDVQKHGRRADSAGGNAMTLNDVQKHGWRADSAGGNAMTLNDVQKHGWRADSPGGNAMTLSDVQKHGRRADSAGVDAASSQ